MVKNIIFIFKRMYLIWFNGMWCDLNVYYIILNFFLIVIELFVNLIEFYGNVKMMVFYIF